MVEWTQGANKAWEHYCDEVRASLNETEADANEVIEDMRRHIETEFARKDTKIVTECDLKSILKRIGLPATTRACNEVNCHQSPPPDPEDKSISSKAGKRKSLASNILIILFGIILPLATLLIELTTRICTEVFFNPIPTIWHVLLFLLIPVANLAAYIPMKPGTTKYYKKLGFLNALAIGVAGIYTLLFLPLLPISVIAILFVGLGFCGLAPLLSFVTLLMSRERLKRLSPATNPKRVPGLWLGLIISVLAMVGTMLPDTVTQVSIQMAASDSAQMQSRGIKLLRFLGDEDSLLVACYRRSGIMTDLLTFLATIDDPASPHEVRGVYYRVTGKPFNSVPPPLTGEFGIGNRRRFDPDFEQGDARVGVQLRDLSLISSRMDGSIDAEAACGYIEWTMIFQNQHQWQQREARSQIQLPSGGVVSRLTLWIDGQEREAAFASRSQTREAYQAVVKRQRDPVLVTTHGPDRILVQCFPVPAKGGQMKIRVGITVPLQLVKDNQATLRMPHFTERNFSIPKTTKHSIWIESKQPIKAAAKSLAIEAPSSSLHALRGELDDDALLDKRGFIRIARNPKSIYAWTNDPIKGSKNIILQSITPATIKSPDRIVLVIDSSSTMKPVLSQISDAVRLIPKGIEATLLIAGDTVKEFPYPAIQKTPEFVSRLTAHIQEIEPQGGMDNVPALKRAWDIASQVPNSVILWVHAGQPQLFESVEPIRQRWERRPEAGHLIEVQAVVGVNRIVESLDGLTQARSLPRSGPVGGDLERLFNSWRGNVSTLKITRKLISQTDPPKKNAKRTSTHLARLWAKDRVDGLLRLKSRGYRAKALATAAGYQLVTPISGAVVLETKRQYKDAGLHPVDPKTVPTIPEPEIWALLIIAVSVLCWIIFRRRIFLRLA